MRASSPLAHPHHLARHRLQVGLGLVVQRLGAAGDHQQLAGLGHLGVAGNRRAQVGHAHAAQANPAQGVCHSLSFVLRVAVVAAFAEIDPVESAGKSHFRGCYGADQANGALSYAAVTRPAASFFMPLRRAPRWPDPGGRAFKHGNPIQLRLKGLAAQSHCFRDSKINMGINIFQFRWQTRKFSSFLNAKSRELDVVCY